MGSGEMRVLQVVHAFPPFSNGGVEKHTYQLSQALSADHDVHVIFTSLGVSTYKKQMIDRINAHVIGIGSQKSGITTLRKLRVEHFHKRTGVKIFKDIIAGIDPDIIHFQHLLGLSADWIGVALSGRCSTFITLHDYWYICPAIELIDQNDNVCEGPQPGKCRSCWSARRAVEINNKHGSLLFAPALSLVIRSINKEYEFKKREAELLMHLNKIDHIISPSEFLKRIYVDHGVSGDKILVVRNGVDTGLLSRVAEEKKKINRAENIVFGYVGRLVRSKGLKIAVEAFKGIPADKAELRIYGRIKEEDGYVRDVRKSAEGVRNIKFMGEELDQRKIYESIDVLIFPSIWYENSPLVLLEALAARIPVIASDIGAVPELVEDGRNGRLFQCGNAKELRMQINNFLEDRGMISKMSERMGRPPSIEENALRISQLYGMSLR
ncbi:MAG: glycosyltransferase family 4 protein [Nitrospirota bacterium]|nr:MAG: glycosyltransferase family 4 protein [Nitrospirota bacterium]